jgi:hypothetical protein
MSLAVDGVRLRGQRGAAHQRGTHGGPSELGRWRLFVVVHSTVSKTTTDGFRGIFDGAVCDEQGPTA